LIPIPESYMSLLFLLCCNCTTSIKSSQIVHPFPSINPWAHRPLVSNAPSLPH